MHEFRQNPSEGGFNRQAVGPNLPDLSLAVDLSALDREFSLIQDTWSKDPHLQVIEHTTRARLLAEAERFIRSGNAKPDVAEDINVDGASYTIRCMHKGLKRALIILTKQFEPPQYGAASHRHFLTLERSAKVMSGIYSGHYFCALCPPEADPPEG